MARAFERQWIQRSIDRNDKTVLEFGSRILPRYIPFIITSREKNYFVSPAGNKVITVCNHEEAEIHPVLHASKVSSVAFVVCEDTGVLILMIWVYSELRSSRLEVFCRKGVLRNFAKFTGKHLRQSLFFNKVAGLCEFCKISKNTFFLQNTSGGCFWKLNSK